MLRLFLFVPLIAFLLIAAGISPVAAHRVPPLPQAPSPTDNDPTQSASLRQALAYTTGQAFVHNTAARVEQPATPQSN
ncbi:MAG: hypothetical protein HC837_21315, partial [Chloroflexaceae bacterium]|nr:hypothetical protein [Chloroflexaceae bacterium]